VSFGFFALCKSHFFSFHFYSFISTLPLKSPSSAAASKEKKTRQPCPLPRP